jgi:hypothetical protein
MKVENAELCGRMARWVLRCVAGVICALSCWQFATLLWPEIAFTLHVFQKEFAEYDFNRVIAGAAMDQSGLTKIAVIILLIEAWTIFNWHMCGLISRWRIWRLAHTSFFLIAFALPLMWSMWYTWELWRYIAVMGITVNRAKAVLLAILFFFSPAFCAVKWIVGQMPRTKNLRAAVICLSVALAVVLGINVAARLSLASHPRPTICEPYGVSVPPAR